MFGRKIALQEELLDQPLVPVVLRKPQRPALSPVQLVPTKSPQQPTTAESLYQVGKSDEYYDLKRQVFGFVIEVIDVAQLAKMDGEHARNEIRDVVSDIVSAKKLVMSIAEQEELLQDLCNDILGYGPLEPLLARDDISDIMVNGSDHVFIEVGGKV